MKLAALDDTLRATLVLSTAPNKNVAKALARTLVDQKLAACVTLIDNVTSIYHWQDEVHEDSECQLIVKTNAQALERTLAVLSEHHPYDVPELLVLNNVQGSEAYMAWLHATLKPHA